MKHNILGAALIAMAALVAIACHNKQSKTESSENTATRQIKSPASFNSDSAFTYIRNQVAFGPRVAGTEANKRCREYIVAELSRHNAQNVNVQEGTVTAFNGDKLPIGNIMASYAPEKADRILLLAHYDTRPGLTPTLRKKTA